MSDSNEELITLNLGLGVANRTAETKVPDGFARRAQDVDISNDGVISRREGFEMFVELEGANSFWSDTQVPFALVAAADTLYNMDTSGALTALVDTLTGADVHYCMTPLGVYWSDGQVSGGVDVLGSVSPWGVETPSNVLASITGGSLSPGTYGVTATFVNGQEGGAPALRFVTLNATGGIAVTVGLAMDAAIDEARVYITTPNGQEPQYAGSCAPGGSLTISAAPRGRPLRTQYLSPLPALRYPALSKGRMFGAVDRWLVWSEPMYYGLWNPTKNFISLRGQVITMLALSDEAGFCAYIGTDRYTYRFAGDSLETASLTILSHVGVMPGSMARVAPDAVKLDGVSVWVPVWIDARGVPFAGVGGGMQQLHDKFAYPQLGQVAAVFDQRGGDSRYLVSGRGSAPSVLAFKDTLTATVIDAGGGSA